MKKILFTYFGEIQSISVQVTNLRTILSGNVRVIKPTAEEYQEPAVSWFKKNARLSEYIVVFVGPESEIPPTLKVAEEIPNPVPLIIANEIAVALSEETLATVLASGTPILVAVSKPDDRSKVPPNLVGYPCYDISDEHSRQAFLCKLVHDAVDRKTSDGRTPAAIVGVVSGLIGTLGGTNSKIQGALAANVQSDLLLSCIHYVIATIVIILLAVGIIAILQIVGNHLRELLPFLDKVNIPPGNRRIIKRIAFGTAAVAATLLTVSCFGKPKHADDIVANELPKWAKLLETSKVQTGGIREHHDLKVPQVWMTSQAVTGMLTLRQNSGFSQKDVEPTLRFIDSARVSPFDLKSGAIEGLRQQLIPLSKGSLDLSKIPTHYPSFALLLGMISRAEGVTYLDSKTIQLIEANKEKYFISVPQPEEGWGYFEQWGWGVTEIAGWVAIADVACLRANPPVLNEEQGKRVKTSIREIVELLCKRQIEHVGGFSPIRDISDPTFVRTYSTIMAVWAISEALSPEFKIYDEEEAANLENRLQEAVDWLAKSATQGDEGWKVNPANPTEEKPFLGLAAQTLCIIGRVPGSVSGKSQAKFLQIKRHLLKSCTDWANKDVRLNDRVHDADRYLYPTDKAIEGSTLLWYPWCVALMRSMATDPSLNPNERDVAAREIKRLSARAGDFGKFALAEYNYIAAEGLIGFGWPMDVRNTIPQN